MKHKKMYWMNLGLLAAMLGHSLTSLAAETTTAAPVKQVCALITTTQIEKLFDRWNASLQTLDPDKVVANYATDAVLLPTVSNKPRTTPAELRDYFVHFLQKHPVGVIDQRIIKIGCNWASDTGLYSFKIIADKKPETVKARYSFVYEYINGQWLIAHQHSSVMPEADEDDDDV